MVGAEVEVQMRPKKIRDRCSWKDNRSADKRQFITIQLLKYEKDLP